MPDEAAYRAIHGDPKPYLPALRVICERHGLDVDDAYMPSGGTNIVWHVRGGPWIKMFPPLWPQDFVRERTGLAATGSVDGLNVPQLLGEGELEGWPYMLLSNVPGHAVGTVWLDMKPEDRVDVARQAGALFAQLHDTDVAACAAIHEDWPAFARSLRSDAVTRQQGYGLDASWAEDLAAFLDTLPPTDDGREVFLHADVTDEHLYLERRDDRWVVTGLIDFGDAMVGDWRYEFAAPLVFLAQGQPRVQRALLEGYGLAADELTPELGRILAGWTFMHRWGRIPTYARFAHGKTPETLDALAASIWSSG